MTPLRVNQEGIGTMKQMLTIAALLTVVSARGQSNGMLGFNTTRNDLSGKGLTQNLE